MFVIVLTIFYFAICLLIFTRYVKKEAYLKDKRALATLAKRIFYREEGRGQSG